MNEDSPAPVEKREPPPQARLHALPMPVANPPGEPGLFSIPQTNGREGFLYVPDSYRADTPFALIVALHGGSGQAQRGMGVMAPLAEEYGAIVFAPQSLGQTWDFIVGGFGPDVAVIDVALGQIYARYSIDPTRRILGGFSDGASYALSLGLANGDVFTHIIAFSCGFADPWGLVGEPRIFMSHGTQDAVLEINESSRSVVAVLRQIGYVIDYVEFEGPHTVPDPILRAAYEWAFHDRPVPGVI